jgi:hypothetical protein
MVAIKYPAIHAMSEGRVHPCLASCAFKVMSFISCPFCCLITVDAQLCRQTSGYVLGTDLNCSESLGCYRQWPVIHPFEITHIQGLESFAPRKNAPNGCDQPIKLDRLGVELVASCR